ncbi:MAG TPA: hypothetical protein VJV74_00340 [Terriglobia bacterium]|nr:hypothetical protein [Terriglobia bacterium]
MIALACSAFVCLPLVSAPQAALGEEGQGEARPRSVIDWSQRELIKAVPELKKLVPPQRPEESHDLLPRILERAGANVKLFFDDFPNTTSVERIRSDRPGQDMSYEDPMGITRTSRSGFEQEFNYIALARSGTAKLGLDEYRTNNHGKSVEPGGGLVTKGFASMSIHFHPTYQRDSVFRYLGRERLRGRDTFVVAFAQRPGVARVVGQIDLPGRSVTILVQGVAWIDSGSFQIVRLHTDLLAPPEGSGLKRQSTEIEYGEVRFKQFGSALWLPIRVTVTLNWRGEVLRNRHEYSDFKLFAVETEQNPKRPESQNP